MKTDVNLGIVLFSAIMITNVGANIFFRSFEMLGRKRSLPEEVPCEEEGPCEVAVINNGSDKLVFCWVDSGGCLHHYRIINDNSIRDSSVSNVHVERTRTGHKFVGFLGNSRPKTLSAVPRSDLVFVFTPTKPHTRHSLRVSKGRLRGSKAYLEKVDTTPLTLRGPVIDNFSKPYERMTISGFRIFYEKNVIYSAPGLLCALESDLSMARRLLPPMACRRLQDSTPIYIDERITYGTEDQPVVGQHACFHPKDGQQWLRCHGLSESKAGCIELYSGRDYLQSRSEWGVGGLLLHELSHAFHNIHCDGSFDCPDVAEAYSTAMEKGLYNCVPVHGPQGRNGGVKAYACTNCMEFFAELSVAFHWSLDDTEFNKWFPHNRRQLQGHDKNSYDVLSRLWNQFE